jgi:chemotaxis signal transduction protein
VAGVEGVTGEAGVFDLPGPPLPAAIPAPSLPTSPVSPVADPFLGSPHMAPGYQAEDPLPREAAGGVLLRLGGSRFAVAMADVAEVTPLPSVTRLPGAPEWLSGVANWRGRMLPVIDIRSLVGVPVTPLATSARLVVVAAGSRGELTAGLVAEAVPGVYDVAIETMLAPPATLPAEAARLIVGQVTDLLGPIAVLDVAALLALRERVDRRRHGS